jgi:hypothetical protein
MGCMLYSLFQNDQTTTLLTLFLAPNNVPVFHTAVSFLMACHRTQKPLLPLIRDPTPPLLQLNRFYLLSTFFAIMNAFAGSLFCRVTLPTLRVIAQSVTLFLKENAVTLRNAPADSPEYQALEMIIHAGSPQQQRILLGPQFPLWMSTGWPHPDLIATMSNPATMTVAAQLLLSGIAAIAAETLAVYSPAVLAFLRAVLRHCHQTASEKGRRVQGANLLPLFEIAATSPALPVALFLVPIAKLLRSPDLVWDYHDADFRAELLRIIGTLCGSAADVLEVDLYPVRIRALAILAVSEEICLAMVPGGFAVRVLALLSSPDLTLLRDSWLLFDEIARFPRSASEFVARSPKLVTSILNTDNNWVMRKFLRFSLHVWADLGPEAGRALCETLLGGAGTISCIYKTRAVLFKGDTALIHLVGDFYETITHLQIPGIEEFLDTVERHLADGTALPSSRDRAATKRQWHKTTANSTPVIARKLTP